MNRLRMAMDVGGTFTDVVLYDERTGRYRADKVSTTPGDLTNGIFRAVGALAPAPEEITFLVHGTTQGLNSLLQRRGVRVLLLATRGVADVYHIARGPRLRLYDLHYRKPVPLLPLRDIVEVGGRFDATGTQLEPLDEAAVRAAARRYRADGFGAVCVAYLFSHINPAHELRTRELLTAELGEATTISLSHETANEWREYERTSSAVAEAYIGPTVRSYLDGLIRGLTARGVPAPLHVMQSSGGITTAATARDRPLQTLLSGPVGGTMGGAALAEATGRPHLICIDMGGTSFDVSLVVDGRPDLSPEIRLEGLPLLTSAVNIHTIGAGGGSVAHLTAGGLRIGPQSAGAHPGPACYGLGGTSATVTDANLLLGRIDAEHYAGGRLTLHTGLAAQAVTDLGHSLGLDTQAMAEGICDVANAKMAQAIRTLTVSRGIEPRTFSLLTYGGAGPMHGVFLARELGIREVLVPRMPGAFSAWGMLGTTIRRDLTEPCFRPGAELDGNHLAHRLAALEERALTALDSEGVPRADRHAAHAVDMRYAAQEYTLTVPLTDAAEPARPGFLTAVSRRFADLHHRRYGHANPSAPVEFTTLRTTAFGDLGRARPEQLPPAAQEGFSHRLHRAVFNGKAHETLLVPREGLAPGHRFTGPAIIVEDTATTVVPPGYGVRVDAFGSLVISPTALAAPASTLPLEEQ
ncbi:hydantoinase/oxoprolinase family protein [Kitasatospora sp. NPDC059571]|uniref:hydantoinase/oxoprolinase family protein n=1 Tax=Kitasatospora sp. NPDC059571 TaxID=3346871 RepID=UPI0036C3CFF6